MKTRKEVLKEIDNAQNSNPYQVAENYLFEVVPLWLPDHLANCTNRLVQEACGTCENPISDELFKED